MTWATSRIWLPDKAIVRAEKRNSTMPGKNAIVELRWLLAMRPVFRQSLQTSRYALLNASYIYQMACVGIGASIRFGTAFDRGKAEEEKQTI